MSFQHFRLGEITPIPQHIQQTVPQPQLPTPVSTTTKQPYGSGDTDDGYTLIFANIDEFQTWRAAEEERNCVEFVKGDTHGSKADPPRFKDHTKLVCARHSRSGRKKYVKKHPDRVRKVPSRKLEGQGCQASISYKTYFDTEQVRACYISQHSHDIGAANLPYTRRGRKAAVQDEKGGRTKSVAASDHNQMASTSNQGAMSASSPPAGVTSFSSAVSMLAPLPGQTYAPAAPQPYGYGPPGVQYQQPTPPQNRWDNMATLFQTVREHARHYEYPVASVAALESVLIRLYLESPIGGMPLGVQNGMLRHVQQNGSNSNGNDAASNANGDD